ncbi:MAG TPA: tetratricopeptide repeat protein [Xanthobacteraceae bacterium]|nr:tetratricopeptide repeat protein [Xanthobacteraceae bacterium]
MKKRIAMRWIGNGALVLTALAVYGTATPAAAVWCAHYGNGSNNCGFYTHEQCLASVAGVGGSCNQEGGDSEQRNAQRNERTKAEPKAQKERPRPETTERSAPPPASSPPVPIAQPVPTRLQSPTFESASALISAGRYEDGIAAMKALGYDDHPDIASAVGYANARLGRFAEARKWYDRALAADPGHLATLNYSGALHVAQGELDQARADLARIKTVCGNMTCPEYQQVERLIATKNQ